MILETITRALKSDHWTIKDAAEQLSMPADELADFCRTKQNEVAEILDDLCELLDLQLVRVFTNETWELYIEEAWAKWGSKEPSLSYAVAKAEEWDAYSNGGEENGLEVDSYEDWSKAFDEREFDAWEATALNEFESTERARLEKLSWVRWE